MWRSVGTGSRGFECHHVPTESGSGWLADAKWPRPHRPEVHHSRSDLRGTAGDPETPPSHDTGLQYLPSNRTAAEPSAAGRTDQILEPPSPSAGGTDSTQNQDGGPGEGPAGGPAGEPGEGTEGGPGEGQAKGPAGGPGRGPGRGPAGGPVEGTVGRTREDPGEDQQEDQQKNRENMSEWRQVKQKSKILVSSNQKRQSL